MTLHWIRGGLERARGRPERALEEHRTAERLAELMRSPFVSTVALRADALQILVRLGQTHSVEATLAQMDDQERDTAAMRGVIAALRLAGDDPQAAAVALAPVIAGSVPSAAPLWLVEALLLEALARDALGDQVAAERALERALDVAEPDHARLHFLLHPVRELLERHARHRTAHAALIAEILSLLRGEPGGYGGTSSPPVRREGLGGIAPPEGAQGGSWGTGPPGEGLLEPLSQAETRVLRYLPTNLTAPEIAGQLSLSVNTVRTHMRHVYDKLGAHRRLEAVDRARARGLLAPSPHRT
jgi:LuxR family maltose regulon positive regulatory protein